MTDDEEMKVLVTVSVAQWRHALHPEMVGEGTDLAHGLFEAAFDLETQAIEPNDLESSEGDIRAHQKASPP